MTDHQFNTVRPWAFYVLSIVLVLGAFLLFVKFGWPGEKNHCLENGETACFCERVDITKVEANEGGVRQPANTWSNLYAVFTSLVVAFGLWRDRRLLGSGSATNVMKSRHHIADVYIFAVLFLGFGSMWFHASMTQWGGRFDGMSMYVFVGYMVSYTLYRIVPLTWLFWLTYIGLVTVFTSLHNHVSSVILIAINVGIYIVLESIILIWRLVDYLGKRWTPGNDWYLPIIWWLSALTCFGLAFMFWKWGVIEHEFCNPDSAFQWHGMWHVFAGFMAVFLYYYWRRVLPVRT